MKQKLQKACSISIIVTRGQTTKSDNEEIQPRVAETFFTIRSATDWNIMPGEIIDSKTLNAFKNNLDNFWKKSEIDILETN